MLIHIDLGDNIASTVNGLILPVLTLIATIIGWICTTKRQKHFFSFQQKLQKRISRLDELKKHIGIYTEITGLLHRYAHLKNGKKVLYMEKEERDFLRIIYSDEDPNKLLGSRILKMYINLEFVKDLAREFNLEEQIIKITIEISCVYGFLKELSKIDNVADNANQVFISFNDKLKTIHDIRRQIVDEISVLYSKLE